MSKKAKTQVNHLTIRLLSFVDILIPYNASDYSREATRQWFWNRLIASLDAPTNGGGGYDGPISPPRLGRNINAGHSTMRSHPSNRRSQGSGSRRAPRTSSEPIDMAPSRVRSDSGESLNAQLLKLNHSQQSQDGWMLMTQLCQKLGGVPPLK